MILLETHIISQVMRPEPSPAVLRWLDRQEASDLFFSTISIAGIGYGLAILPEGARRRALQERFENFLSRGFEGRILGFDVSAAQGYALLMARRRQLGRPISALDGQLAAIAHSHHLSVATRNVRDFDDCGVAVVNPFTDAP